MQTIQKSLLLFTYTPTSGTSERKIKTFQQMSSISSKGSAAGSNCYKEIIMMYHFITLHC